MNSRKKDVRAELLWRRHARSAQQIQAESQALCSRLISEVLPPKRPTVAAYVPMDTEPGCPVLLDALRAHCQAIYLPISHEHGRMSWARETGTYFSGRFGVKEPEGPPVSATELRQCSVWIIPTLGLSPEGYRLGKGGGYYDRLLAGLDHSCRPVTVCLLFDDELMPVPIDAHDQPVDMAVTPSRVLSFS